MTGFFEKADKDYVRIETSNEVESAGYTSRDEGVLEGLQEAAFICEGYAARLAEGNEHHSEFSTVCECSALIDQRIREKQRTFLGLSKAADPKQESGRR